MYRQSRLIEWIKQTVPNEIEHLINLPSEMFALIARGEINFARRKRTVEVVDSVHDKKNAIGCRRLTFFYDLFSHMNRYRIDDGCGDACVSQAKYVRDCTLCCNWRPVGRWKRESSTTSHSHIPLQITLFANLIWKLIDLEWSALVVNVIHHSEHY